MTIQQLPKVTRVEVIDDDGRSYSEWNVTNVQLSLQDNEKTLKIFLNKEASKEE